MSLTKQDLKDIERISQRAAKQAVGESFRAYTEHVDDKFKILVEGQKNIRHAIEDLKIRVTKLERHMDKLEARVAGLELRLDKVELRLQRIEIEVKHVKQELSKLRDQKANRSKIHSLETRVARLEEKIRT